jgi:hypothetical protein
MLMKNVDNAGGAITPKHRTRIAPDVLGWREWVALPDLGIPAIKAKIDTGARTSALHAFRIEPFYRGDQEYVRFWLHPLRNRQQIELICEAPVVQKRLVKDSGGHSEERYVIESAVRVGDREWNIELTLTSREDMMFRMLLGRSAITRGKLKIDPAASYVTGRGKGRIYTQSGKSGRTRK